jgi:hypothetical protein
LFLFFFLKVPDWRPWGRLVPVGTTPCERARRRLGTRQNGGPVATRDTLPKRWDRGDVVGELIQGFIPAPNCLKEKNPRAAVARVKTISLFASEWKIGCDPWQLRVKYSSFWLAPPPRQRLVDCLGWPPSKGWIAQMDEHWYTLIQRSRVQVPVQSSFLCQLFFSNCKKKRIWVDISAELWARLGSLLSNLDGFFGVVLILCSFQRLYHRLAWNDPPCHIRGTPPKPERHVPGYPLPL